MDNRAVYSGGRPLGPSSCLAIQIVPPPTAVSDDELPGIVDCDTHLQYRIATKKSPC
jgi:hypothetical protein